MASPPMSTDVLAAMRDAAMATAQAQLKLAAACAAALGEDAPKLTKDGRKARGKREKDPNRPAYAETAYQLFMKETRATNTTLPKGKEAMRLIGEMWSKLPEAEKSAYQARAAKSREKYQAALAEYNASKKAAAKADAAAPAAEAKPSKKRRKSEDGSEKKKVCVSVSNDKAVRLSPVYVPHRKRRSLSRRKRRERPC